MSANPKHSRAFGSSAGASVPGREQVMNESFAAVPDAVAQARLALVGRLRGLGADDQSLDDVALAVSEACTNAVVHAYRETTSGTFEVAAAVKGDLVHVSVTDYGGGLRARTDSPGLGLGLPLITSLSDSLAVRSGPRRTNGNAGGPGTVLSMTFTLRRQALAPR